MWKFSRLVKQGHSNKLLNKNKSIPKYLKSHLFDGRPIGEMMDVGDIGTDDVNKLAVDKAALQTASGGGYYGSVNINYFAYGKRKF